MADVNATALPVAKLSRDANGIDRIIVARAIVIDTVSNTALKRVFALCRRDASHEKTILPGFIIRGFASAFFIRWLIFVPCGYRADRDSARLFMLFSKCEQNLNQGMVKRVLACYIKL
jgi:hypothetical protein